MWDHHPFSLSGHNLRAAFSVLTGEDYLLEFRLTCESHGEPGAQGWSAYGDFLNSASATFSTDDTNLTLQVIRPEPTFTITGVEAGNTNNVMITWESFPGNHYAVEGSGNPATGWETLIPDIAAAPDPNNRTTTSVELFAPNSAQRFYRVVELGSASGG